MKKKILLVITVVLLALSVAAILCSCEVLKKIPGLNKLIGGDDTNVTKPKIVSVETIKNEDGWLESKEYLFNKNCTNPMPVNDNESYFIVINYYNPSNLSISSVKVNGSKIDSTAFAEGSDSQQTKLYYEVGDNAKTEILTYVIGNVMYVNGTSTVRMGLGDDLDPEELNVQISVRPQFKLTLQRMDVDYRAEKAKERAADEASKMQTGIDKHVTTRDIYYKTDMSYGGVFSPDYDSVSAVSKDGGFIFAGYYTKPNGEGDLISETDPYYFWCDMTLYAHFERMYDLNIISLTKPILYDERQYNSGAVVVNRDFKTNPATHYINLQIPNTVVIETITYTERTGQFGLPVYTPSVSTAEYPVVKIDSLAFRGFNTIQTASIGKFIEEIGYGAFWKCTKIGTFSIPRDSELKYIGDQAFRETEGMGVSSAPFTLPSKVEYIGSMAFRGSGWGYTATGTGGSTSTLTVPATWKYIGYKAFMGTSFTQVNFEAGCYFDSQITEDEGSALESAEGNRAIQYGQNRIGARLFAGCLHLNRVEFATDPEEQNGLNIIPDYCFDIFNYTKEESDSAMIQNIFFAEGLTYIGQRAFFYQKKIPRLNFPTTLEEVDCDAFYECENVIELTFGGENSRLKILHNSCFGNLVNLDSCTITSAVFEKYGSGVFRGCDRLKCVIFENATKAPVGYLKKERVNAKGNDLEVVIQHKQADFLYATGEAGMKENGPNDEDLNSQYKNDDAKTYSTPMRIFCPDHLVDEFTEEMKRGKEMEAGSHSTGTSVFNSQVFVHSLNNYKDYSFEYDGETIHVKVAVQEVYKAVNGSATKTKLGYSLVYWSERTEYMPLPTADQLNLSQGKIIEISHYALPTSVTHVYIPAEYKYISHNAFDSCARLTNLEFEDPDSIEYIGDYAFFGSGITHFEGGENLTVIGQYAFQRCLSLRWVDLSKTKIINNINDTKPYGAALKKTRDRFKYEYELKDDEDDYYNYLGYGAFKGCRSLTWIYLPKDIQQIPTAMFTNCPELVTVIIPTKKEHINTDTSSTNDYAFYQYAQANTVFNTGTIYKLKLLVDAGAISIHGDLFPNLREDQLDTISEEKIQRPE